MSTSPRVWFITGCSSGFGHAMAEAALLAGDHVIATARQVADLEMLEHIGAGRCHILPLDVTDAAQVSQQVTAAQAVWGRLDVVVNNAGYGLLGAVEECTEEQIRLNFETNFFGALNVIRAALPILRQQKQGHIINISAAAAISNYAGFGIYGAAKAALESLSESLRLEVAAHGTKVTLVQPGPFRTRFIGKGMVQATATETYAGSSGKFAAYLEKVDGKQPGDPERAAALIVKMVQDGQAPLRLALGKYAVKKVRDVAASRLRELEAWEQAAGETDG
ncbi:SDR family NAD(P)-dependent oxidoreductase [Prosthecobacter dejongeii]|uniref:NAD(P)-dependent dehydrogenase (Short-subunit alcohol dehydrogenase family) n=1 Tax=Prosthecobacter dejongeii TaxID=48465 RepID=A0A7W7YIL9_9BACT|nr:SDR family NAD(P)-dependent oxidoreductase [Prosthecobacter dejongeii]MBB5036901.1 NAD(P)-dependent dehydrogenase (short-subunit alcohol dehydrogenase family) [Prosthecobacter dejongeii]